MMKMPTWVLGRLGAKLPQILLASLVPLALFMCVLFFAFLVQQQPEGLVGEPAKEQRKDVLGYIIYVVAIMLVAAHGMIWSVAKLTLDAPITRPGERLSFAIGWLPIRSVLWTFLWLLFAVFGFIAAGMVLGTLGFNDPGMLLDSTGEQAAALADGTREVVERGDISQPITMDDFNADRLRIAAVGAGAFAVWILLKALAQVPMRVLGLNTGLGTGKNVLGHLAAIRATVWVMLGGLIVWLINANMLALLPTLVQQILQGVMFVLSIWLLGGMLAWHAQKSVG